MVSASVGAARADTGVAGDVGARAGGGTAACDTGAGGGCRAGDEIGTGDTAVTPAPGIGGAAGDTGTADTLARGVVVRGCNGSGAGAGDIGAKAWDVWVGGDIVCTLCSA
jgi:hypothetical protein